MDISIIEFMESQLKLTTSTFHRKLFQKFSALYGDTHRTARIMELSMTKSIRQGFTQSLSLSPASPNVRKNGYGHKCDHVTDRTKKQNALASGCQPNNGG
jgi:hypothetical protein